MSAIKDSRPAIFLNTVMSKIFGISGWFLTVVFGLTLIGTFTSEEKEDVSVLVVIILILALGIFLIVKGRKQSKLIKLFKRYVAVLSTDPHHSIDNLASITGQSTVTVTRNLDTMIKKHLFTNAYVDVERHCIVFPQKNQVQSVITPTHPAASPKADEYITIICSGCGANNKVVKGVVSECEFCGANLK